MQVPNYSMPARKNRFLSETRSDNIHSIDPQTEDENHSLLLADAAFLLCQRHDNEA